jgi:hypothetical protein
VFEIVRAVKLAASTAEAEMVLVSKIALLLSPFDLHVSAALTMLSEMLVA